MNKIPGSIRNGVLHLGITGCGWIASSVALFARIHPKIRLRACCDANLAAARKFAAKYAIPHVYTDHRAMLENEALDAVYLAVPHHLHAPLLSDAGECAIPTLCEKPLARTLAEGQQIVQLAQTAGVKIGINYQYRYDPALYRLARAIQAGELGAIQFARISLAWQRGSDYFTRSPWHASFEQSGGGTLLTQASHFIDFILWACASPAVAASGTTARQRFAGSQVEDTASATLELANGALVSISSAMIASPSHPTEIAIFGEKGSVLYREGLLFPHLSIRGTHLVRRTPPASGLHPLQRSLEAFRAWITQDTPYLIPAPEALPVLAAVEGIYRAARQGSRVEVEKVNLPGASFHTFPD